MGKDKRKGKKKSNSFDYMYGSGKVGDLMDRYDIQGTKSYHPDMRGPGSGLTNRTEKDVNKDIAKAMMNDYDTRRGMEAAALAGDKDAAKFAKKGFKAGNIYSAWDKLKSLKKEHVGGGGMNGAKNIAGLTQALVQHERDTFIDANDAKYATKDELADALKQQMDAQAAVEEEDPELSQGIQDAQERSKKWMETGGNIGGNPYGGPEADSSEYFGIGASDDEQDASAVSPADTEGYAKAQSYLGNFKDKLKSEGKFVSNL